MKGPARTTDELLLGLSQSPRRWDSNLLRSHTLLPEPFKHGETELWWINLTPLPEHLIDQGHQINDEHLRELMALILQDLQRAGVIPRSLPPGSGLIVARPRILGGLATEAPLWRTGRLRVCARAPLTPRQSARLRVQATGPWRASGAQARELEILSRFSSRVGGTCRTAYGDRPLTAADMRSEQKDSAWFTPVKAAGFTALSYAALTDLMGAAGPDLIGTLVLLVLGVLFSIYHGGVRELRPKALHPSSPRRWPQAAQLTVSSGPLLITSLLTWHLPAPAALEGVMLTLALLSSLSIHVDLSRAARVWSAQALRWNQARELPEPGRELAQVVRYWSWSESAQAARLGAGEDQLIRGVEARLMRSRGERGSGRQLSVSAPSGWRLVWDALLVSATREDWRRPVGELVRWTALSPSEQARALHLPELGAREAAATGARPDADPQIASTPEPLKLRTISSIAFQLSQADHLNLPEASPASERSRRNRQTTGASCKAP